MNDTFEYDIKTKNNFAVISLKGVLNKNALGKMETLHQELLSCKARSYVLSFKDVLSVDASINRHLSIIQQDIRKDKKTLYLIGLNLMVKQRLNEKGIIRLSEIKASLEDIPGHKSP
jgi:anti-anti-sigma regulatory factor